jgi:pyruvate dehydrogenase E1 component alpha subunit
MPSARVDGFDPIAVRDAALVALGHARAGTPYLLETITGRMKGHSVVDPARYRTRGEAEAAKAADPVAAFAARLRADDVMTAEEIDAVDQEVTAEVTAAAAFADASPHPDVSTLFDYTYATPVPNDSRRLPGEALFPAAPRPGTADRVEVHA